MMVDNEIDMVARGNTMEELKALAPAVESALPGELTIRDDSDDGTWSKIRQQLSKITQHASVVIEQERWFDKSGNPHEFFHFSSVPDGSHQMIQIMEQCRGELVVLTNEVNHRVSQHEQVHDEMRATMDTAFDYMARITHGLH